MQHNSIALAAHIRDRALLHRASQSSPAGGHSATPVSAPARRCATHRSVSTSLQHYGTLQLQRCTSSSVSAPTLSVCSQRRLVASLAHATILTEAHQTAKSQKQRQRHRQKFRRRWSHPRRWQLGAHRKSATSCRQLSTASHYQHASSHQQRAGILRPPSQQQWPTSCRFALCIRPSSLRAATLSCPRNQQHQPCARQSASLSVASYNGDRGVTAIDERSLSIEGDAKQKRGK